MLRVRQTVTDNFADACPYCGGLLTVEMDLERLTNLTPADLRKRPIGVWRYAPLLPACEAKAITLKEGGTPLYDCRSMANKAKLKKVYVKFEGANPTGSFKDRGMTVGVTRAVELGCKVVGCASTGNTSGAGRVRREGGAEVRRAIAVGKGGSRQTCPGHVLRGQDHFRGRQLR